MDPAAEAGSTHKTWVQNYQNVEQRLNGGAVRIRYRKETGKPPVSYNDAVEEALCYGWIDSTVKSLDDERFCTAVLGAQKNQ